MPRGIGRSPISGRRVLDGGGLGLVSPGGGYAGAYAGDFEQPAQQPPMRWTKFGFVPIGSPADLADLQSQQEAVRTNQRGRDERQQDIEQGNVDRVNATAAREQAARAERINRERAAQAERMAQAELAAQNYDSDARYQASLVQALQRGAESAGQHHSEMTRIGEQGRQADNSLGQRNYEFNQSSRRAAYEFDATQQQQRGMAEFNAQQDAARQWNQYVNQSDLSYQNTQQDAALRQQAIGGQLLLGEQSGQQQIDLYRAREESNNRQMQGEFENRLKLQEMTGEQRLQQTEKEYTLQQKQRLTELQAYRDKVLSYPGIDENQKQHLLMQIDAAEANIKPSLMPQAQQEQFPAGQKSGETWSNQETGAVYTRTQNGEVKLIERGLDPVAFSKMVDSYKEAHKTIDAEGNPVFPSEEQAATAVQQRLQVMKGRGSSGSARPQTQPQGQPQQAPGPQQTQQPQGGLSYEDAKAAGLRVVATGQGFFALTSDGQRIPVNANVIQPGDYLKNQGQGGQPQPTSPTPSTNAGAGKSLIDVMHETSKVKKGGGNPEVWAAAARLNQLKKAYGNIANPNIQPRDVEQAIRDQQIIQSYLQGR